MESKPDRKDIGASTCDHAGTDPPANGLESSVLNCLSPSERCEFFWDEEAVTELLIAGIRSLGTGLRRMLAKGNADRARSCAQSFSRRGPSGAESRKPSGKSKVASRHALQKNPILLSNARNAIRPLEGTVTIQVSRNQT